MANLHDKEDLYFAGVSVAPVLTCPGTTAWWDMSPLCSDLLPVLMDAQWSVQSQDPFTISNQLIKCLMHYQTGKRTFCNLCGHLHTFLWKRKQRLLSRISFT